LSRTDLPRPLLDLIRSKQSFLLTGHEHPDGDCVGAQVALSSLLGDLGKDVVILNPDPLNPSFDFLERDTSFQAFSEGMEIPVVDVVVLLDCATLRRTARLGEKLRETGAIIAVIDHHVGSEDGDGEISYVDATAASTGTLIYRMFKELSVPVSRVAAQGIFLSLVSDTGWFRYSNTDVEVMSIAGELVNAGVEPSRMYDTLFRRNDPESLAWVSQALALARYAIDGNYAYLGLGRAEVDHASRIGVDTDILLEMMRSVEGVEVVCLLKELEADRVKISLRAKGDVDVEAIARQFDGGGHKKAAGASLSVSMEESQHQVEEAVRSSLAERAN
jgi:phosphoesterase RecJ-like protein